MTMRRKLPEDFFPARSANSPVDQMLRARDSKPGGSETRFLKRSLDELIGTPAGYLKPLISGQHSYRWLALDPASVAYAYVTLDAPLTAGTVEAALIMPGSWVPVAGRDVYVYPVSPNGTITVTGRTGDLVFWATSEQVPPPLVVNGSVGSTVTGAVSDNAVNDDDDTAGIWIPPLANHVTVHIVGTGGSAQLVAEAVSIEVFWYDGVWAHHPDDDFDAAGRGVPTTAHDVEAYEIPHNFTRMALVRTGDPVDYIIRFTRKGA